MTKKSNLTFDPGIKGKFASHKKRLPTVKCVCGFEILVVPDLKAMNRAIKNHVVKHKQAHNGSERLGWLTEFLTEQVLIVASKINLPNVNHSLTGNQVFSNSAL